MAAYGNAVCVTIARWQPVPASRSYFPILSWTCQNRSVRWAVSADSLP